MEAGLFGPCGRIVLGSGIVTVGRATDNQVVVNTPTASSHHAEIRSGDFGYSLTDLGSTNGTLPGHRTEKTLVNLEITVQGNSTYLAWNLLHGPVHEISPSRNKGFLVSRMNEPAI